MWLLNMARQSHNIFLVIKGGLTWFTLELSLAVSQTSAAHQVAVLCLTVPLLSDLIVDSVVMAPFCLQKITTLSMNRKITSVSDHVCFMALTR